MKNPSFLSVICLVLSVLAVSYVRSELLSSPHNSLDVMHAPNFRRQLQIHESFHIIMSGMWKGTNITSNSDNLWSVDYISLNVFNLSGIDGNIVEHVPCGCQCASGSKSNEAFCRIWTTYDRTSSHMISYDGPAGTNVLVTTRRILSRMFTNRTFEHINTTSLMSFTSSASLNGTHYFLATSGAVYSFDPAEKTVSPYSLSNMGSGTLNITDLYYISSVESNVYGSINHPSRTIRVIVNGRGAQGPANLLKSRAILPGNFGYVIGSGFVRFTQQNIVVIANISDVKDFEIFPVERSYPSTYQLFYLTFTGEVYSARVNPGWELSAPVLVYSSPSSPEGVKMVIGGLAPYPNSNIFPSPTVSFTSTPSKTSTSIVGVSYSSTSSSTSTSSESVTPTSTVSVSQSPSPTASLTRGASPSVTPTPSNTASMTGSGTATPSPLPDFNAISKKSGNEQTMSMIGGIVGAFVIVVAILIIYRKVEQRRNIARLKMLSSSHYLEARSGKNYMSGLHDFGDDGISVVYSVQPRRAPRNQV